MNWTRAAMEITGADREVANWCLTALTCFPMGSDADIVAGLEQVNDWLDRSAHPEDMYRAEVLNMIDDQQRP